MKRSSPEIKSLLAAEYVIGLMRGAARKRFEREMLEDNELQNNTRQWENHLTAYVYIVDSVEPADKVWNGIEQRLNFVEMANPNTVSLQSYSAYATPCLPV